MIETYDFTQFPEDPDSNAAVCRIVPRIDLEKINEMIREIPEEIGGFSCYFCYTAGVLI